MENVEDKMPAWNVREKVDKEEIEEINAKGEKEKRGKKNWLPKEEVEEVVRCWIM